MMMKSHGRRLINVRIIVSFLISQAGPTPQMAIQRHGSIDPSDRGQGVRLSAILPQGTDMLGFLPAWIHSIAMNFFQSLCHPRIDLFGHILDFFDNHVLVGRDCKPDTEEGVPAKHTGVCALGWRQNIHTAF